MKSKFIIWILIARLVTTPCMGQGIFITGKTVSEEKDSLSVLANCTVALLHSDSSFMKGAISDSNGIFSIKNIPKGHYVLKTSATGYADYYIVLNNLGESLELGEIILSIKPAMLQEVIVAGSRVIQKIDRALYYPLPSQVKKSNNAYDLLRNLMIPRLYVDPRQQRLEASGGQGVEIRINNVPAKLNDLSGLLAKDILRVEYLENPGNRYGVELGVVVNIITKKREDGGQLAGQFSNAAAIFWGENFLSGKYNHKKSQWALSYTDINRGFKRSRDDQHEVYLLEQRTVERFKLGIPAKSKSHDHYIDLAYNISDPDKYVFNVAFRNNISMRPYNYSTYKLFSTGSSDTLLSRTFVKSSSYSPSLDVYYQKSLSQNRTIELNVVGTKINSDYERKYSESETDGNMVTDILRNVDGDKYSLIADLNFDKEYKKIKLSGGLKHNFGRTNNVYSGSVNNISVMNQAETRMYMELTGKIKSVGYVVGSGLTRSYFRQGEYKSEYYTFTPLMRLNYNPTQSSNLRYNFYVAPRIPSLSSLTNMELMVDTVQVFRGNPGLKMYNIISNNLSYSINVKKIRGSLMASYHYHHRPVMEDYIAENNKIINTENNQKAFATFNTELSLSMSDVKLFNIADFLSMYAALGYLNFQSRGNSYVHHYNDVYYNLGISFTYHNLEFGIEQRKWKSNLFGETLREADRGLTLLAGYRKKNLQVGMMVMDPFGINKYPGIKRLSKSACIDTHTYYEEFKRLLVVRVVYNLEFGKAYKTRKKNKNNSDTETGIIKW
ncbi:MAG: hypothetical protein QM727_00865 [Niabella sp.]